jgi:hypothetical protein
MKFDRQIVAISLVNGATVLYSDDDGVAKFAAGCGLKVKRVVDLPVPASQESFPFPEGPASPAPPVETESQPGAEEERPPEPKDESSDGKPDQSPKDGGATG